MIVVESIEQSEKRGWQKDQAQKAGIVNYEEKLSDMI